MPRLIDNQKGSTFDEYVIDKDYPENDTSMHEPLPAKYRYGKNRKLALFSSMRLAATLYPGLTVCCSERNSHNRDAILRREERGKYNKDLTQSSSYF
jgi:hypothetical protein